MAFVKATMRNISIIYQGKMSKSISLLGDNHICPMVNPAGVPHVGGPVINPGQSFVRITGRPVAVTGGHTFCTGMPGPDAIVKGSTIMRIGGRQVARVGDRTAHGGTLVFGSPYVRSS
jgi:uncharacterized Zn-binding protein involved in type VI secretion